MHNSPYSSNLDNLSCCLTYLRWLFFVQVAKVTTKKSKTILTDIERWQKGVASTDVFGVPIEVTVQ
ncbi:unnamed protein product, partial [Vitis vinifera]